MTRSNSNAAITALAGRYVGEAEAVADGQRRIGGRRRATVLRTGLCRSVFGGTQLVQQGLDDPPQCRQVLAGVAPDTFRQDPIVAVAQQIAEVHDAAKLRNACRERGMVGVQALQRFADDFELRSTAACVRPSAR